MSLDRPIAEDPYAKLPAVADFQVTSARRHRRRTARRRAGRRCGTTLSPQLSWSGAPEGTKSFVVTCFDPDAPTPSGFWHWVVVDLAPTSQPSTAAPGHRTRTLPGNAFHVRNDGGQRAFMGAAPPQGDHLHRYYFVVHAVGEETLGVDGDASPAVVSFNLAFKTLGRAIITGDLSTLTDPKTRHTCLMTRRPDER